MKTSYKFFLTIIALIVTVSCSENLSVMPTSSITVESFWQTEDDAKAGLSGLYSRFRGQASQNLYTWGGARSDEMSYGLQASEGRERYFENSIDANASGPDWRLLYTAIHDANLILKYVPEIDFGNENEKNTVLAQAYVMRAFIYFKLTRIWGAVPLVTEPTEGVSDTFRARADAASVFELIKQDIDDALTLFQDDNFSQCRCEWSAPAANALKGEVYLWTAKQMDGGETDITTALNALEDIHNADVALLNDYDDIFRYNNKGNEEILMVVHLRELESGQMYNNSMYIRDDEIPSNITQEARDMLGIGGGLNRWAPSAVLRDQFNNDDSRKNATFVELYQVENGDSTYYASAVTKFRGFTDAGSRNFLDDVVLYRYADVLLMIAEAKNALDQDPSSEMNKIRERAYGDNYPNYIFESGTQVENDEAILKERLLELSFENKRWFDLVRFNKAFDLVPSLQNRENENHLLLWPIPQSTLSLNSNLEQNPGY
ncbi:MAG: RagB/SusD family nutrient uptake outer membrane protein [Balneolales bacterium]